MVEPRVTVCKDLKEIPREKAKIIAIKNILVMKMGNLLKILVSNHFW